LASADNFQWRNDSKKWRPVCKPCISLNAKKRYSKNKEVIKTKASEYRKKNRIKIINFMREYNYRDEVQLRMKQYRIDNRKKLRQKEKAWRQKNPEKAKLISQRKTKKRNKNALVRIRQNVSRAIGLALKRKGSSKQGDSIFSYLPYSFQDLKKTY
jgi:hypothetical protein